MFALLSHRFLGRWTYEHSYPSQKLTLTLLCTDLAATRARLYMQDAWDANSVSVSSGEEGADEQWRKYELPRVQENLKKRMVFF